MSEPATSATRGPAWSPSHADHPVCQYCFARLTNGRTYCGGDCENGAWRICPTLDGEVFEPEPEPDYINNGMPPKRPVLELEPQAWEAAPPGDRAYLAMTRLRQHLVECGL